MEITTNFKAEVNLDIQIKETEHKTNNPNTWFYHRPEKKNISAHEGIYQSHYSRPDGGGGG
ncbi:hypothetical protein [Legionella shakespearei]|uniref:Uncharacterized protein n=1 Tax=Legionella shakespearei DSM 23087 TaxID=1122169 RepID=A0A0W0YLG3_9GAMM|nr:hypothetical protein [Legionella shakespearei]KTD57427.1 hypothetical protein Lsha_2578 [Legionella shakespearei DSM 23087]